MAFEQQMSLHTVCNLDSALEAVDGDRDLLCRMIELFMKQCPTLLQEIGVALDKADRLALQRAAHTLRGSVCNFGADRAYDAASRVERAGRAGDWPAAADARATLEKELEKLRSALADFLSDRTP